MINTSEDKVDLDASPSEASRFHESFGSLMDNASLASKD
jgi:hypothetical protein